MNKKEKLLMKRTFLGQIQKSARNMGGGGGGGISSLSHNTDNRKIKARIKKFKTVLNIILNGQLNDNLTKGIPCYCVLIS